MTRIARWRASTSSDDLEPWRRSSKANDAQNISFHHIIFAALAGETHHKDDGDPDGCPPVFCISYSRRYSAERQAAQQSRKRGVIP
jgi:hypothetical protein